MFFVFLFGFNHVTAAALHVLHGNIAHKDTFFSHAIKIKFGCMGK